MKLITFRNIFNHLRCTESSYRYVLCRAHYISFKNITTFSKQTSYPFNQNIPQSYQKEQPKCKFVFNHKCFLSNYENNLCIKRSISLSANKLPNKSWVGLNFHRKISTHSVLSAYIDGKGSRTFYEPSVKGPYAKKDLKSKKERIKEGLPMIKVEVKKWVEEMKEKFEADPLFVRAGDFDILYDFKTEEDLKQWIITSDSDHGEGYSHGSLTLSPTGHALFSGEIDITVPKDGEHDYAGYSNMALIQPMRSFMRKKPLDFTAYTHFIMRLRGDGRKYLITFNTAGEFDVSWSDVYTYVLYTRGGPYWQNVKIPFSKFLLGSKGRAQDKQCAVPLNRINSIGFTCANVNAPFRLEIDYIGVEFDPVHKEEFAYEMYRIPAFIV